MKKNPTNAGGQGAAGDGEYLLEQRLLSLETKVERLNELMNQMADNQMLSATLIKRLAQIVTGTPSD
jgi:hypothetical protein